MKTMPKPIIHPHCRKCNKLLTDNDLKEIEKQISALSYPSSLTKVLDAWYGVCQNCKDVNDFVVS